MTLGSGATALGSVILRSGSRRGLDDAGIRRYRARFFNHSVVVRGEDLMMLGSGVTALGSLITPVVVHPDRKERRQ
jgi:hypothetical protein